MEVINAKRRIFLTLILLPVVLASGMPAWAGPSRWSMRADQAGAGKSGVFFFAHEIGFNTVLDNREYHTDLDYSRTIFAAGIDAAVGLGGNGRRGVTHRLMTGASALYAFGGDISAKWLIYYQLDILRRGNGFRLIGGSFSRSLSKAYYSDAFFDLADRIYIRTRNGIQFSWTGRDFYYEIGLDWRGEFRQTAPAVREEFVVYSGGRQNFNRVFGFGYSAMLHHYANSWNLTQMKREKSSVVDDILANPYLDIDLSGMTKMQKLLLRAGYLQGFQRDRRVSGVIRMPARGNFLFEVRHWNVGIISDLYFGGELMPFYDLSGADGIKYGSNLYMGDPIMRNPDGVKFGIYDRLSIYWEANFLKGLNFRLQIDGHFNNRGFAGWNQKIFLIYKLPQDSFKHK